MWRLSELAIDRSPTQVRRAVELMLRTVEDTVDDRVPGLAAEVAFFVLLSLPPLLLLGLGTVGYIGNAVPGFADDAAERLLGLAGIVLTDDTVGLLRPVVNGVLTEGRADLASLGVVLTLYSASRALRVIVVALTIAYDLPEQRQSWHHRVWGLGLTIVAVIVGVLAIPLLVLGPGFGRVIGSYVVAGDTVIDVVWRVAYWPVAAVLATALLAALYHVAAPWTTPWLRDLPGAALAMVLWLVGSAGLRLYTSGSVVADPVFAPLAGPVVLLLWLYVSAFAVLLGAELNAEIEKMWPTGGHAGAAEREGRGHPDQLRTSRPRSMVASAAGAPTPREGGRVPELVLGPLQRFADKTTATVWVETDRACRVTVLDSTASTFRVHGHHYALVEIDGLEPDTTYPYVVTLDGEPVWPPVDYELPDPVIRTRSTDGARIAFGSCRGAAPLEPPWTLERDQDDHGLGPDALTAYANRMIGADETQWPDLLLLLGDQVYADDASPETRAFIRQRRDTSQPPGEEIADFTEYTHLYRESWSAPLVRWLLSTLPVAMIFDDHDIIDDWNISQAWLDDIRETSWWHQRIVGGLVAYWIYQHVGNLSPSALAEDALYQKVRVADDAGALLDHFAETADRDPETARWSFERHLGDDHLIVVDSRAARVLEEGSRDMLDDVEWRWLEARAAEPCRHLLIATSLPVLMPRSVHDLERWNERLVAGAWGRRVAAWSERVRQDYDLEHWSAFPRGMARMLSLIAAAIRRPDRPNSVTLLSGDVHHGYVSRLRLNDPTPVHQVVASPMRQSVDPALKKAYRVGVGAPGRAVGKILRRLAGLGRVRVAWDRVTEPIFDNHVATIEVSPDGVDLRIETAHQHRPHGPAELRAAITRRLV